MRQTMAIVDRVQDGGIGAVKEIGSKRIGVFSMATAMSPPDRKILKVGDRVRVDYMDGADFFVVRKLIRV